MKQKSSRFLRINEKFYSRKNHIEQKIKNLNLAKNSIYSKSMLLSETSENSNRNLAIKKNIIKLLSERNMNNFKSKEKYYKKLISNTSLNKNKNNSKDNRNVIIKNDSTKNKNSSKYKYIDLTNNDKRKDKSEIYIRKKKFEYKHITPIKYNNNEKKIKKNYSAYDSQKLLLYKDQIYGNRTSNDASCNDMDTNDTNSKSKKGAFSFSKILKSSNSSEKRGKKDSNSEFKFKDEKFYFENKFKIKNFKNRPPKKQILNLDKLNLDKTNIENDIKKKNNIILLSFRSDKRSKLKRENRISTSSEKDSKARNGALKILDLLKNKKSEKIVIKEKDNKEEERINSENKENINSENINNIYSEAKANNSHSKDIFNEIFEEVKQEKNIVQKIVHRKIIQGVRELKLNNSINSTSSKYNTRTYREKSNNILENPNNFSKEENTNSKIPFFSCEKDKYNNKKYLKLDIDDNRNISKNISKKFKGFKTFNNDTDNNDKSRVSNDNTYTEISERNRDDYRGMKIKKIKLDKLKNKLKKNSLNYYKGDNININLNLSNRIINIHNSHRIYAPKRVSITKRPSADMLKVPFYLSHSPNYKCKSINSKNRIYQKNEESNDTTYVNKVKPFNEISIFDLEKNNENKEKEKDNDISFINNSNSNNNCKENIKDNKNNNHGKENVKKILYSKVKISKKHSSINIDTNQNLSKGRCKTIRYIRKSKNKIERINNNIRNETENKIVKTQEMQFGITSKPSDKSFNYLDRTEPINFNLNAPLIKQNSFIKYKTYLSNEMNEIGNNTTNNNIKKMNAINLSHIIPNNYEEQEDNFSTRKFNTGICKLCYNFSYDKIMNNMTGADDIIHTENEEIKLEQIVPLLSFEDLLIIEDKFNLVLIVLEKGNKTYEEYFDLWNFFFSSTLKSKFEQIFKYFVKETEYIKIFVNYTLIFIMICYDFAVNDICVDIDRNSFSLIEVAQIIYSNILIIINKIKSKIILDNNNNYNIRLIELSKIDKIISNKLANIDSDDILFVKEILHKNINLIIKKVTSILDSIKNNNILKEKYNSEIFSKIKITNFEEINQFFFENVLKEDFLGCSITAFTYIKERQHFRPLIVPYLLTKNKKKYSLILDLDETLIHFKVNHNENDEGVLKLRPGVFTFLEKVEEFYEIILFSEASEEYTLLMMEAFKNKNNKKYFDYKLYRKHCIIIGQDFIKDLSRIGRPLDKTIIIDNLAQNFKMQKSNGIIIKPFLGEDQNDQALIDLIPILVNIARDEIDVRNGLMKYRDEILTKISSNLFRRNKQNNN